MFLALQYGMCVLSFATIITMFASAIGVVLLLVMIACRSISGCFVDEASHERTVPRAARTSMNGRSTRFDDEAVLTNKEALASWQEVICAVCILRPRCHRQRKQDRNHESLHPYGTARPSSIRIAPTSRPLPTWLQQTNIWRR